MNVLRLAWAYAGRRPLATFFNVLLLAVGVATITLVILLVVVDGIFAVAYYLLDI